MKYFRKPNLSIWAFEADGSQDHLVTPDMTPLSDVDLYALQHPAPSAEQQQALFTTAIQKRLDDFARTRGYDNILSACTYATSRVPKFAAEGQCCVNLRDSTWAAAYTVLAEVGSGARAMPTLDVVLAELPALEWPQ